MTSRRTAALVAFDLAAIVIVAGLAALAVWQVHRRAWKLDLIARIEARVHAFPVPAPAPSCWADISTSADEYRRVTVTGYWLRGRSAFARAGTELGDGYWVMTPLVQDDGMVVLVNRGFVPADKRDPASWGSPTPRSEVVTGLLRMSEPGGAFLRSNDPAADRWFSRDVAAIAASRGLPAVAPYFIDAERRPGHSSLPVGGLTVISFSNNHLLYAATWCALALLAAVGAIFVNLEVLRPGRFRPQEPRLHL